MPRYTENDIQAALRVNLQEYAKASGFELKKVTVNPVKLRDMVVYLSMRKDSATSPKRKKAMQSISPENI